MPQKWNLQDIRPASTPNKSTQRTAPVRSASSDIAPRTPKSVPPLQRQTHADDADISTLDIVDGNAAKRKRIMISTTIAIFLIVFGFIVNIFLGGAKVTVYPKVKDISIQSEFTAYTAPQAGELSYELLSLEASAEKQVKASGKEQVTTQATGKIFVYNTTGTKPQRLITNTRFETSDGLIYRIKDSIEVPPPTKDASGNLVPGKVVADVYADAAGEKYNIAPSRFTVPGLKGTEQYNSVYGESTAAFTGGFDGEKYIIDEAELQTAKQQLHIELRDTLIAQLREQIPAGFILYEAGVTFVFESLPSTEYGDSLATIKEHAKLQVPIFKAKEFATYIAEKSIPDYKDEPVYILDPSTITFSYTDPLTAQADIGGYNELDFTLKGTAKIIWEFDNEKLKKDLLNLKKTEATTVFSNYRSIANAEAEVRPFWATTYPEDSTEIDVITIIK